MKTRIAIIAFALFLSGIALQAQPHHGRHHGPGILGNLEQMQEELDLTANQVEQLEALKVEMDKEKEALKSQEFEDHHARREAFHEMMESYKDQVDNILTEEQKNTLKEKRKERHKAHREQMEKVDKKGMRAALRQHQETKVKPVLLEQRAKLEAKISAEDKQALAELRTKFAAKKAEMKAKRKEMKGKHKQMKKQGERAERPHHRHKQHGERMKNDPDHQALMALAEKYEEDIDALMQEIEPQHKQWQEEKKAIIEEYMPKDAEHPQWKADKHHKNRIHGHRGMRKGHFLLMDPNDTSQEAVQATTIKAAQVFPNPASSRMTLSYELLEDGKVTVELRGESGGTAKVLDEGFKPAGAQRLEIDASTLNNGVYYIAISSGKQQATVKVIVAKQ